MCCHGSRKMKPDEDDSTKNAMMKCRNGTAKPEGRKSPPDRNVSVCLMHCLMKELDMMEDDGSIKKEAIEVILKRHEEVYSDDAKQKMKEICYDKKDGPLKDPDQTKCNKEPYNMVACTHQMKEMFCPEDKRIENKRCNAFREEIKKTYSL